MRIAVLGPLKVVDRAGVVEIRGRCGDAALDRDAALRAMRPVRELSP